MAEPKTKPTDKSVDEFLQAVPNERRRQDSYVVLELMKQVTGAEPRMWGDSIVGFGSIHYEYASGREGDWPVIAFSPRKQSLTLYIMPGFEGYDELLHRLGKFKTGKTCLYINKLDDVDRSVLRELVSRSVEQQSRGD